jgi:hypothetical protein
LLRDRARVSGLRVGARTLQVALALGGVPINNSILFVHDDTAVFNDRRDGRGCDRNRRCRTAANERN